VQVHGVGIDGDVATARSGLESGELKAVPNRGERLGHLETPGVEVDAVPAETEDLAASHPGRRSQPEQHGMAVAGCAGQEVAEFSGGP